MASYKTHEFRYNQPENGPAKANDISVSYDAQVEVVGVDGEAPDDPEAEYTLEGDGSRNIKISDIEKSNDQTIKIRVKGAGAVAPRVKQAFWTLDGKRIPKALSELGAAALDAEPDATLLVQEAIQPLLLEMRSLSRCLNLLAAAPHGGSEPS